MLFEVYRDNKRLMYTNYEECIPTSDILKSMKEAGCKILLDGKEFKLKKENKKTKERKDLK